MIVELEFEFVELVVVLVLVGGLRVLLAEVIPDSDATLI